MDMSMVTDQVVSWIETQFAGQSTISKDELVAKAQQSDLPQEAKDGLQQMPEGTWSKDELIGKVRDMIGANLGSKISGAMGGIGKSLGL
jgi:hypothetical protein